VYQSGTSQIVDRNLEFGFNEVIVKRAAIGLQPFTQHPDRRQRKCQSHRSHENPKPLSLFIGWVAWRKQKTFILT
jgi:hypothetical protein